MYDKILILSPHTDDGELGCGGTVSKLILEGRKVYYVAFSSCEASIPINFPRDILKRECSRATEILGIPFENVTLLDYEVRTFPLHRQKILDEMIRINEQMNPDLVLLPSSNDLHQDHQTIHREGLRAFKKTSSIWGYEHPWNNLTFTTDVFVKLEERHLQKKIDALKQYKSQSKKAYLEEGYIKALAYTRGLQANFSLAETFELLRMLVV